MRLQAGLAVILMSAPFAVPASADDSTVGWFAWFHTQDLNDRWQFVGDAQLRTADGGGPLGQTIVRPGLSYKVRDGLTASFGYAYVENIRSNDRNLIEHRPWQQLQWRGIAEGLSWLHRMRLEQRFLETARDDVYSDRLRYMVRLQHNLPNSATYVAGFNEIFVNLSGRDDLNGRWLDRNRLAVMLGRPVAPGVTLEAGYLNQYIKGRFSDRQDHVLMFNAVTRF